MTRAGRPLLTVLIAEGIVLAALLVLAFDQYAHAQREMTTGINARGYRGPIARERAYDETRLMMVGGARAFQPGVPHPDTTSARMRFMIEQWVTFDHGPVTAVNLALPGLPRGGYAERLDAYRHLAPDVICVYPDLSPVAEPMTQGLITRLTGYVPALAPLVSIDRAIGGLFGTRAVSDEIVTVAAVVDTALTMVPGVVVAIPEPATVAESADRDALLAALARFAEDRRVTVIQLKDGPPAITAGVLQPADAIQIEPALSAFLRARPKTS